MYTRNCYKYQSNLIANINILVSANSVNYEIINSFTNDTIKESALDKKISTVYIDNSLYENELKFIGNKKVEIFTKHIGIINNKFGLVQE